MFSDLPRIEAEFSWSPIFITPTSEKDCDTYPTPRSYWLLASADTLGHLFPAKMANKPISAVIPMRTMVNINKILRTCISGGCPLKVIKLYTEDTAAPAAKRNVMILSAKLAPCPIRKAELGKFFFLCGQSPELNFLCVGKVSHRMNFSLLSNLFPAPMSFDCSPNSRTGFSSRNLLGPQGHCLFTSFPVSPKTLNPH